MDIVLPDYHVAIEFNGNYWHSDKFMLENHNMTASEYHNMKYLMTKEQGYELLFVWEFDWYDEKLQSRIMEDVMAVVNGGKVSALVSKKSY